MWWRALFEFSYLPLMVCIKYAAPAQYEVLCPRLPAISGIYERDPARRGYRQGRILLECAQGVWQLRHLSTGVMAQAASQAYQPAEVSNWRILVGDKVRRCRCTFVWPGQIPSYIRLACRILAQCEGNNLQYCAYCYCILK